MRFQSNFARCFTQGMQREKRQVFAIEALAGEWDNEEEALAGLNGRIRMAWRCSTELYAEMLMAVR